MAMHAATDKDWQNALRGEPELKDVLSDPIIKTLMKRDGVNISDLQNAVAAFRCRQRGFGVVEDAA
jgi:hypothetical protein